jgi:general secretion pathway protein C
MTPRQARIGVDLFTACVVASVGVALAGLTWRLLGDPGTRYGAAPVAARPSHPIDLAPIIAASPFGAGGSTANAAGAPVTDQPLVLRGILLASPRSASTAVIQIGDAPATAFAIGQAAGAATIEAIEIDHVVLTTGGQRQMLAFPQKPGSVAPSSSASGSPPPPTTPQPPSPTAGAGGFLQSLGATQVGDSFRVGEGASAMGRLAGLQPGDQIERINGQGVADLARDPNAYARLSSSGAARIELVRGGQRLTLIVPLR